MLVTIAIFTNFTEYDFNIDLLKSANMNHIEIHANIFIDAISS